MQYATNEVTLGDFLGCVQEMNLRKYENAHPHRTAAIREIYEVGCIARWPRPANTLDTIIISVLRTCKRSQIIHNVPYMRLQLSYKQI